MLTRQQMLKEASVLVAELMQRYESRVDAAYITIIAAAVLSVEAGCDQDRSTESFETAITVYSDARKRGSSHG